MSIKKKITRIRKLSSQRWHININAVAVVCAALIIHYFRSTVFFVMLYISNASCHWFGMHTVVRCIFEYQMHVPCTVKCNKAHLHMKETKIVTLSQAITNSFEWFHFVIHTKSEWNETKHHKKCVNLKTQNVLNF